MGEVSKIVIPTEVNYFCDMYYDKQCRGKMFQTGNTDTNVSPALYQHKCNVCGNTEVFEKKYPSIEFH